MTYLFLFSVLAGAPQAPWFRVTWPTVEACNAARSTVIVRHFDPASGLELVASSLAICSADPELPSAIALGTIPIEAIQ